MRDVRRVISPSSAPGAAVSEQLLPEAVKPEEFLWPLLAQAPFCGAVTNSRASLRNVWPVALQDRNLGEKLEETNQTKTPLVCVAYEESWEGKKWLELHDMGAAIEQDRDKKAKMFLSLPAPVQVSLTQCCSVVSADAYSPRRPEHTGIGRLWTLTSDTKSLEHSFIPSCIARTCLHLATCGFGWKILRTIHRLLAFIPYDM